MPLLYYWNWKCFSLFFQRISQLRAYCIWLAFCSVRSTIDFYRAHNNAIVHKLKGVNFSINELIQMGKMWTIMLHACVFLWVCKWSVFFILSFFDAYISKGNMTQWANYENAFIVTLINNSKFSRWQMDKANETDGAMGALWIITKRKKCLLKKFHVFCIIHPLKCPFVFNDAFSGLFQKKLNAINSFFFLLFMSSREKSEWKVTSKIKISVFIVYNMRSSQPFVFYVQLHECNDKASKVSRWHNERAHLVWI